MSDGGRVGALVIDGGHLPLGGGLLALVRPALNLLEPGAVLAVLSSARGVREDLAAWCRIERHEYLGVETLPEGRERHLIERGSLGVPRSLDPSMPEHADPSTGFAPRGARIEPGGPSYPFSLLDCDRVAPPEVAQLYEQAVAAQWDATRDIPWDRVRPLPAGLSRALAQTLTFLAENELSALYVPSRFISRIHPVYVETAMFLATQLADEARHIDVFLKRARLAGVLGISSATTARSLLSLLELEDFTEATFLLSVLGEGTFLDLLRFIERHAPDEPTSELVRRARADETRHVHFGLAHVRHALSCDAGLYGRLEAAVRKRAATLHGSGGVPAPIQDALTILAAHGDHPGAIAEGHEAFRELLEEMDRGRKKRLESAGFTAAQAEHLSALHTPNFM